jgi:tRNA(adenine34) deaminase
MLRDVVDYPLMEDERWMAYALKEAEQAFRKKEVPVGAVVVHDGRLIGRGYNQIETLQDPTAHAEMIAITAAADSLGGRRLEGCTLYVTLEPCTMCAGAIVLARIPRLVFGTRDPKAGACGTLYNIVQDERLNHRVTILEGVLAPQCSGILQEFFQKRRNGEFGRVRE